MSWEKKFGEPIRLKGGRELKTLTDARAQILGIETWVKGSRWEYAIELLLKRRRQGKRLTFRMLGRRSPERCSPKV